MRETSWQKNREPAQSQLPNNYAADMNFIHPPFRQIFDFQPDRFPHFRASNLKWGSSGAVGVFPTRFNSQKHNI